MKVIVEWEYVSRIKRIEIVKADQVDRTKLGKAIGKSKQYASHLLNTGNVPSGDVGEMLVKKIRRIPFKSVSTQRKMPTKRPLAEIS